MLSWVCVCVCVCDYHLSWPTVLVDVTRILLLDDAQGKSLAKTVSRLLKEIGRELTAEQFPVS